jgi:hypothetical protein
MPLSIVECGAGIGMNAYVSCSCVHDDARVTVGVNVVGGFPLFGE